MRKYGILWESICSIILYNTRSKTSTSIQRSKYGVKKMLITFIIIIWGNCWKQEFQILSRRKHITIHDFHTKLPKRSLYWHCGGQATATYLISLNTSAWQVYSPWDHWNNQGHFLETIKHKLIEQFKCSDTKLSHHNDWRYLSYWHV